MGAIYASIVARASVRATDDELDELATLGRQLARERDADAFRAVNDQAMRLLIAMARSPRLEAAARAVTDVVPGNFFAEVPGTMEPQRRAMGKTIRATVARDAEAAAASLRALPATQGDAVVALLRSRGVLDD
jgi:DNA-binding GntR family transcriptional regulator